MPIRESAAGVKLSETWYYTVYFRTDAEYSTYEFKADTPEQVLALAHKLYDENPSELMFEPYDDNHPVHEIEIRSPYEDQCGLWRDEDLWLHLAARDLFEALEEAMSELSALSLALEQKHGESPYGMSATIAKAAAAIAKAKGGAA